MHRLNKYLYTFEVSKWFSEWTGKKNYKYLHGKMDEYERIEKKANHERTNPLIASQFANVSYAVQATSSANKRFSMHSYQFICFIVVTSDFQSTFILNIEWILASYIAKMFDELFLDVTSGFVQQKQMENTWNSFHICARVEMHK